MRFEGKLVCVGFGGLFRLTNLRNSELNNEFECENHVKPIFKLESFFNAKSILQ